MASQPRSAKLVQAEARLKAAQDKARRRALGKPLPLSDVALDAAATVGEVDAVVAEAAWDASSGLPGLLDAEVRER